MQTGGGVHSRDFLKMSCNAITHVRPEDSAGVTRLIN